MFYAALFVAKILVCLADLFVICVSVITVAPITLVLAVVVLAVMLNSLAKDIQNKK